MYYIELKHASYTPGDKMENTELPVKRSYKLVTAISIYPEKKKIITSTKIKEYCSKLYLYFINLYGSKAKSILEPSSGVTGMRFKIARERLVRTIMPQRCKNGAESDPAPNLIVSPKISASAMFESGPAIATIASPHLLLRKLYGLYGIGLAQPKAIVP